MIYHSAAMLETIEISEKASMQNRLFCCAKPTGIIYSDFPENLLKHLLITCPRFRQAFPLEEKSSLSANERKQLGCVILVF